MQKLGNTLVQKLCNWSTFTPCNNSQYLEIYAVRWQVMVRKEGLYYW